MPSKNTEPFLGEKTTFAKKYPQIKSVRIEYEQMESRLAKDERKGWLTETNVPPTLPCMWKQCHEGGFAIESQIIQWMISKQMTVMEETLSCCGHEVLDRRQHPKCPNYLKFKATIEFHDSTGTNDNDDSVLDSK